DLSATYDTRAGAVKWHELRAQPASFSLRDRFGTLEQASGYLLFQLQTAMKQDALLKLDRLPIKVWDNSRPVYDTRVDRGPVLLELQPGSNDVLLRTQRCTDLKIQFQAKGEVIAALPEMLTAAALAARLEEAAKDSKDAIAPEFLGIDWTQEARKG